MFLEGVASKVFGSADVKLESTLKNPNQFREAVLFESLSNLPDDKIKEFVKSPEAKNMCDKGIITHDMLERLSSEEHHGHHHGTFCTTVLHMAKEENDPLWDEFVKHRIEERRIMNDLIAKYKEKAQPVADNANKDFVEGCIPEYFRK